MFSLKGFSVFFQPKPWVLTSPFQCSEILKLGFSHTFRFSYISVLRDYVSMVMLVILHPANTFQLNWYICTTILSVYSRFNISPFAFMSCKVTSVNDLRHLMCATSILFHSQTLITQVLSVCFHILSNLCSFCRLWGMSEWQKIFENAAHFSGGGNDLSIPYFTLTTSTVYNLYHCQ